MKSSAGAVGSGTFGGCRRMAGQIALFSAGLARLARCAIFIACVALISMNLVEGWQVFARYVLNDSPSWTEPVALVLMSAAMMFGAPWVSAARPTLDSFCWCMSRPRRFARCWSASRG